MRPGGRTAGIGRNHPDAAFGSRATSEPWGEPQGEGPGMTSRDTMQQPGGVQVAKATGTPSSFPGAVASDAVLERLEFAAALDVVAGYAAGPLGAASVRRRRPADSVAWASRELAAAGEIMTLLARDDRFDVEAVSDVSGSFEELAVAGSV